MPFSASQRLSAVLQFFETVNAVKPSAVFQRSIASAVALGKAVLQTGIDMPSIGFRVIHFGPRSSSFLSD